MDLPQIDWNQTRPAQMLRLAKEELRMARSQYWGLWLWELFAGAKKCGQPLTSDDMSDQEWEDSARAGAAMTPDELIEAAGKLDALTGKLQALERNILSYAEKLGLTPAGRVRLAQKRAQTIAEDPDSDLFGD